MVKIVTTILRKYTTVKLCMTFRNYGLIKSLFFLISLKLFELDTGNFDRI